MHSRDKNASEKGRRMDADTPLQAAAGQVSTELGGEAVILHIESGRYFSLDGVGHGIWQLLGQPRTPRQLVDWVVDEFDVDRQQCEQDVDALIHDFLDKGLVRVVTD